MNEATILFSIRPWNPVSWLIRWALPVSRFKWARASHSMILDGDHVIHATMLHGVVRQPLAHVLRSQKVVARREYDVPDLDAGLVWARSKVGTPYDSKGALGISLKPDRQWQEDDKYFCHELCAAFIHACGRKLFDRFGHVTDTALLLIKE
jgi:hypothetical protein